MKPPLTHHSIAHADPKQYELVKEALAERAHLLNAAPYMAHAMPIMIPIYKWWELPYMWVGAKAYDFIAGSRRMLPASRFLSKVRPRNACVPTSRAVTPSSHPPLCTG